VFQLNVERLRKNSFPQAKHRPDGGIVAFKETHFGAAAVL
jgi:hypothetical protein